MSFFPVLASISYSQMYNDKEASFGEIILYQNRKLKLKQTHQFPQIPLNTSQEYIKGSGPAITEK